MKFKKTRKERVCSQCSNPILKGNLYGEKSKTIISDPKGQCIGSEWNDNTAFAFRLSKKFDYCFRCGNG